MAEAGAAAERQQSVSAAAAVQGKCWFHGLSEPLVAAAHERAVRLPAAGRNLRLACAQPGREQMAEPGRVVVGVTVAGVVAHASRAPCAWPVPSPLPD